MGNKGLMAIANLGVFLIALNFLSCQYENDDVFEPNIEKPKDIPSFNVYTNLPDSPNFTLYYPDRVYVSVDSGDVEIVDAVFYIDSVPVRPHNVDGNIYINLNPNDHDQHKLFIEVFTTSGSNSIADELGVEGYKFMSPEWTFGFKDFNERTNVSSSLTDEGALMKWNNFNGLNPFRYIVRKLPSGFETETDHSQLLDTTYIGEAAEYEIYIKTQWRTEHLWGIHKTRSSLPRLRYDFINNRNAITWEPSVYADKIKEYRVYTTQGYQNWEFEVAIPSNLNYFYPEDYFECVLGSPNHLLIETVPIENTGLDSTNYQSEVNLNFGVSYRFNDEVVTNNSEGAILKNNMVGKIRYHNASTGFITNLMTIGASAFKISPDFKTFIYHPTRTEYKIFNLENLHETGSYEFVKTITLDAESALFDVTFDISNNGIMVTFLEDSIWVYDMFNEKLIGKIKGLPNDRYIISPDGKRLILLQAPNVHIYHINDESVDLESTHDPSIIKFYYMSRTKIHKFSDDPTLFVLYGSPYDYVEFWRYDDLTSVKRFDNNQEPLSFDEKNGKYITAGYNGNFLIYVHDLDTGEIIKVIPKDQDNYNIELNSFISNNFVYTGGYRYILSNE